MWKGRAGAAWRGVPGRYGPWKTAYERLRLWTADGTGDRIPEHVIVEDDSPGTLGENVAFVVGVDSTPISTSSATSSSGASTNSSSSLNSSSSAAWPAGSRNEPPTTEPGSSRPASSSTSDEDPQDTP
ncbi:transposase [Saccharothrix sp. BKS2]|uniref:transposase n=1 Tax=Saccharothrix sp. BKS2 TaxID=3064400 RepID=UPI0039EC0224